MKRKLLSGLFVALLGFWICWPLAELAACTNTTNLSLCKPAIGDSGWGTNLNTNMDLIDARLPRTVYFFKSEYGGVCDSTTDNTTALNTALSAIATAGGGTLVFEPCGTARYKFTSANITIPNLADGEGAGGVPPGVTYHTQRPIRLTGQVPGGYANGITTPMGGAILDFTFNTSGAAKIMSFGRGLLEIDHLTIMDSSSPTTSIPFLLVTGTTPNIHNVTFIGTKTGASADQDGIILGGTAPADTDAACSGPSDPDCAFQGYQARIKYIDFLKLRTVVKCQTWCNANVIESNNVWSSCGGTAAFDVVGHSANGSTGNVFANNLIEVLNYTYGIRLSAYANNNTLTGNSCYDPDVGFVACHRAELGAQYNLIQSSMSGTGSKVWSDMDGSNTLITGEQSYAWRAPQGLYVGATGIINSNSLSIYRSDIVTNGNFTGSATGWTLGAAWAYGTNAVDKNADGTNTLSQAFSPTAGKSYKITYTISNWSVGTVTVSIGGTSGTARGADGTYTETLVAAGAGNLAFTPTDTARFTIDSVSIYCEACGDKWEWYPYVWGDSAQLHLRFSRNGAADEEAISFQRDTASGYYTIDLLGATRNMVQSSVGPLKLRSANATELWFGDGTTDRWYFTAGNLTPYVDKTYNIGSDTKNVLGLYLQDLYLIGKAFAALGTPANGTVTYCSNCDPGADPQTTCASAGAQTGALAVRLNGAWICF